VDQQWAPDDIDLSRPSVARVYDYFLGGSHHFAVDRELAEQVAGLMPDVRTIMRTNRAFLRRAVRYACDLGITQFLDIGSGIPTVGNVHEVAQQVNPDTRVVYVDRDPVAVAHSRAMLEEVPHTAIVRADVLRPAEILASPAVHELIDFDRPVALMLVAVLHFVDDDEAANAAVAQLRDTLAPGSILALSHATGEGREDPATKRAQEIYRREAEGTVRPHARVLPFFGDFALVEPGLVYLPVWRPDSPGDVDDNPERFMAYAGVGLKQ
jgi:SAM-dependent methyltransferase